jgi:hypothetical protein
VTSFFSKAFKDEKMADNYAKRPFGIIIDGRQTDSPKEFF